MHHIKLSLYTAILSLALGIGCGMESVDLEQTSSAVTGPWLYLPLSKIGKDVNGYHGWNIVAEACGTHYAEDLSGTDGDPVLAAADGIVLYQDWDDGSPDHLAWMTIRHPATGYTTRYFHLKNNMPTRSGEVKRGDVLGQITYPLGGYSHVHFTVRAGTDNISGCTLGNTTGGCVNPGDPPGLIKSHYCSGDGADPGSGMWVTNGQGVVALANLANACTPSCLNRLCGDDGCYGSCGTCGAGYDCAGDELGTTCVATNASVSVAVSAPAGTVKTTRNGTLIGSTTSNQLLYFNLGDTYAFQALPNTGYSFSKFCGDSACSITTTTNPMTGTITTSSGNVFAYFRSTAPTCPASTQTGWLGAGYYCGDQQGMLNTSANTLYYCASAGGATSSPRSCGEGCRHMPDGQNDKCWDDTSTCYTWRNYNTYACGGDSVSGNPLILYHCNYGALSVSRTCPNRCVTWPGHDDYCQ